MKRRVSIYEIDDVPGYEWELNWTDANDEDWSIACVNWQELLVELRDLWETAPRFDVTYGPNDVRIDYHFCRDWESDKGCYGTNPNHGYTFEKARELVAEWFEQRAEYWRELTLDDWRYNWETNHD